MTEKQTYFMGGLIVMVALGLVGRQAPVVGPTMMPSVRASRIPASNASLSSTAMMSSISE